MDTQAVAHDSRSPSVSTNEQEPPQLQSDIELLSCALDAVIGDLAGDTAFGELVAIRQLAAERRQGSPDAERRLATAIAELTEPSARNVARALGIFFDLANIAEDLQRIRVLRQRERERHPLRSRKPWLRQSASSARLAAPPTTCSRPSRDFQSS